MVKIQHVFFLERKEGNKGEVRMMKVEGMLAQTLWHHAFLGEGKFLFGLWSLWESFWWVDST